MSKTTSESVEFKNELINLRNSGKAIFGYSYWHIMELIRNGDDIARENRIQRAKTVDEICGRNCFPYPSDRECGFHFPNNGIWMPRIATQTLSAENILKSIKESLLEKEGISRKNRRSLSNTKNLKTLFSESKSKESIFSELQDNLPISDEITKNQFIERFLAGSISPRALNKELQRWITDPVYFFDFWYVFSNKNNHLEEMVEGPFTKLKLAIDELIIKKKQHNEAVSKYKKAYREFKKTHFASGRKNTPDLNGKVSKHQGINQFEFSEYDFNKHLKGINYINCYIKALIDEKIIPNDSDFGDLMHLYQHDQVDLIRIDKRMHNIFSECKYIATNKLVKRRTDLLAKITEAHSNK
ncbi:hypothetical protein [Ahrensia marina]|nr:hypothetical protein [Ahrensia marina]